MTQMLLDALNISVHFGALKAVDDASVTLKQGEILGIVGESGSGKTTLIRALMGLTPLHAGQVMLRGEDVTHVTANDRTKLWRQMQMIFQDPSASLSPRLTVEQSILEPLRAHGTAMEDARQRVAELMAAVGLPRDMRQRRPTRLSGGQKQRVVIARALALKPDIIVADEPMSALDVSVKAQIAKLFLELREREGVSFIIVAHDLALMAQLADRLVVMQSGKIVETGPTQQMIEAPKQPYTQLLRDACLDPMAIAAGRQPKAVRAV